MKDRGGCGSMMLHFPDLESSIFLSLFDSNIIILWPKRWSIVYAWYPILSYIYQPIQFIKSNRKAAGKRNKGRPNTNQRRKTKSKLHIYPKLPPSLFYSSVSLVESVPYPQDKSIYNINPDCCTSFHLKKNYSWKPILVVCFYRLSLPPSPSIAVPCLQFARSKQISLLQILSVDLFWLH